MNEFNSHAFAIDFGIWKFVGFLGVSAAHRLRRLRLTGKAAKAELSFCQTTGDVDTGRFLQLSKTSKNIRGKVIFAPLVYRVPVVRGSVRVEVVMRSNC